MVNIRSINEIILGLIDYYKLVQPDLDTKPGTVARDVFIDGPSSQISLIYDELANISNLQSIKLASGGDLDKLASNFGLSRNQGSSSNGAALLTFNNIDAPLAINSGDLITSKNGMAYSVINGISLVPASANYYRSIASKFKNDLDFVGISDQYAIQVLVVATSFGSSGNIGKYSLSRTNIIGISNVTNASSFTGGSDQESDAVFRNRILSVFNGASVGTSLGYKNTALGTTGVIDSLVIGPGDPLMTRDGTVVAKNADGSSTIVSEGQGGKVDVIVLGQNEIETIDSFIYKDKSNTNDATNEKNNFVLGQISGDENKTINRRRIDDIAAATLPNQPVDSIVQVNGSLSGPNFQPKSVDSLGRVSGNYELIKDTGLYAGCPWGFDTFKWISNKISLFREDLTKGQFNGQDPLTYSGVLDVPTVQQNISIINENSTVTSDRSIIQLLHYPATNITRVFNTNTGERYLITNQNLDGTGSINQTGRIKISGNTLPSTTDILQVDYNWVFNFDPYSDFDGKFTSNNIRDSVDTVDWGYCSRIKNEKVLFTKDAQSNIFNGTATHPINSIVSCDAFRQADGVVSKITSGVYFGRLAVQLSILLTEVTSIDNIYAQNTRIELYNTAEANGKFTNSTSIVGTTIVNNCYIILPTDTRASENQIVSVIYSSSNVFSIGNSTGSTNINNISIPAANIDSYLSGLTEVYLNVSYIANIQSLFSGGTTLLPISRSANGFVYNNIGFNNQYNVNNLKHENYVISQDLDGYYVELSVTTTNYNLTADNILSVIRLSDSSVLWDGYNKGTVTYNVSNNNYQVLLSGLNSPELNDQVIIFYYASNNNAYQPFSYINYNIKNEISQVGIGPLNEYYTTAINFVNNTYPLKFEVIDPATQYVYATSNDGYIVVDPLNTTRAALTSSTEVGLNSILGITNFKIKITDGYNFNNCGTYDIVSYDALLKKFIITLRLSNLTNQQVSVIRLSDNKDLWNNNCYFDLSSNKLILSSDASPVINDKVFILYYNYDNLRTSGTNLSITSSDQNKNPGSMCIVGTTITKISDVVFTAATTGLKLNVSEAVQSALGTFNSNNVQLARVVKLEKVETSSNNEVISVLATYDLLLSQIKDNSYYISEFVSSPTLANLDIVLPSTVNNTINTYDAPHLPKLGDKLRITCYVVTKSDSESINFTSNGTYYTNKKFALVDRAYVSSGFKSSGSTSINISSINQPLIGSRYRCFYDYTAPKTNERIVINFNYNKLISDVTFNIENSRPVNADVIVKQAVALNVDATMNIVVSSAYLTTSATVLENVRDKVIASINLNALGGIIDSSDLVNSAYGVPGVDRARIVYFNKTGTAGQVLSLTAQKNEYFSANNVIVNIETR